MGDAYTTVFFVATLLYLMIAFGAAASIRENARRGRHRYVIQDAVIFALVTACYIALALFVRQP